MSVAVDSRSLRWTKQKPSKLLPVALYAAFSAVTGKPRSMPMNFLSYASIFTTSLQTFTHLQFGVGSACFAFLRRRRLGSASVSLSSEGGLLGGGWRLPARPCPGSAGFELVLSSVPPSVFSEPLPPPPPSAPPAPSAPLPLLRWPGSVWLLSVPCKGGWCD